MKWEYLAAAVIGILIFSSVCGFGIEANKHYVETHCLSTGKILINDSIYECRRVGSEVKP